VLICVKTAAILGAVLSLDSLKEEDYMRLVKMAIEPKDRITALYECQHPWPCSGKPAVIFHDRGKIFTRRSRDPGVGRPSGHHDRTSSALRTICQRVSCILHSLHMMSVFLQICEHSSEERAHQAAGTPPSLDH